VAPRPGAGSVVDTSFEASLDAVIKLREGRVGRLHLADEDAIQRLTFGEQSSVDGECSNGQPLSPLREVLYSVQVSRFVSTCLQLGTAAKFHMGLLLGTPRSRALPSISVEHVLGNVGD